MSIVEKSCECGGDDQCDECLKIEEAEEPGCCKCEGKEECDLCYEDFGCGKDDAEAPECFCGDCGRKASYHHGKTCVLCDEAMCDDEDCVDEDEDGDPAHRTCANLPFSMRPKRTEKLKKKAREKEENGDEDQRICAVCDKDLSDDSNNEWFWCEGNDEDYCEACYDKRPCCESFDCGECEEKRKLTNADGSLNAEGWARCSDCDDFHRPDECKNDKEE